METDTLIGLNNLKEALQRYGQAASDLYRVEMQRRGKNASFDLSNSVDFQMTKEGTVYTVSLSLLEYWKYIEYGRKPGKFPPIDKIREWVEIKPLIPRPMANGKLPTLQQLAFLIGRKIAREGIAPEPILHDTVVELNQKWLPLIRKALERDLYDMTDVILRTYFNFDPRKMK